MKNIDLKKIYEDAFLEATIRNSPGSSQNSLPSYSKEEMRINMTKAK